MNPQDFFRSELLQIANGMEMPFSQLVALLLIAYLWQHWDDYRGRWLISSLIAVAQFNAATRVVILIGLDQANAGLRDALSVQFMCLPTLRFGMALSFLSTAAALGYALGLRWYHFAAFGSVTGLFAAGLVFLR